MLHKKYTKIFGVGPLGAVISLVLLLLLWWIDHMIGHPLITADHPMGLKAAGVFLIAVGVCLHLWTVWTLRHWWVESQMCRSGPFKYFRHPMYAAWITFIAAGVGLYLNSWIILLWPVCMHPIWHRLVGREEKMMGDTFGDEYRAYAKRTGRFVPRILSS